MMIRIAVLVLSLLIIVPAELPADGEAPQAAALARRILDDAVDRSERERIVQDHPDLSVDLLKAMVSDLEPGTPGEYQRIPWIWRVTVAAGRRNRADEIRDLLDVSLPKADEPLHDWQAVVIGGGIINGISLAGPWPGERISEILGDRRALTERWQRSLELAATMADDPDVPTPTRYDALRMIPLESWEKRGDQLVRYLEEGTHDELQMGAVSGLGDMPVPEAIPALLSGMAHYSEHNRHLALDALLRNDERRHALLDAVESGQVRAADLGERRIQALKSSENERIRTRARELLAESPCS